jgi:membrane protein YdbS with pleckstrin-like domain
MVKFGSTDDRPKVVLLSSIATSIVLVSFFLLGAFLINISRGKVAYTQVDMAAGSIFVFVITMIISLSLWPKVMDRLENREKSEENSKLPVLA